MYSEVSKRIQLVAFLAAVLALVASIYSHTNASAKSQNTIKTVIDAEDLRIKMQEPKAIESTYVGEAQAIMEAGKAEPLSLGSGDFDGDGTTDVLGGYAIPGGGVIALYRGNSEATNPRQPQTIRGLSQGRFPAPFLEQSPTTLTPERPDLIAAGDVNKDGTADVLIAARGSNTMYLFMGTSAGFAFAQRMDLPGSVTSLIARQGGAKGGGLDVIVGVVGSFGSAVLIYSQVSTNTWDDPVIYPLPAEPSALALGRLHNGGPESLVIACGTHLLFIDAGEPGLDEDARLRVSNTETIEFSFAVKAVALGDFISDREHRTEVAVLAEDGSVHIVAHGELDRRPLTESERQARLEALERLDRNQNVPETEVNKGPMSSQAPERWTEVDRVSATQSVSGKISAPSLLLSTRISSQSTPDLVLPDPANNRLQVLSLIEQSQDSIQDWPTHRSSSALDIGGAPVAVLPMRLNVDGMPDLVILKEGHIKPVMLPSVITATFDVDRTDDNIATGGACTAAAGDCSLRGAIRKANSTVGSDMITFSVNGTFTLTLSGAEGNFSGNSAINDLDILSDGNSGTVDDVTIVGNGPANTIIQAGTTKSTNGTDGNGIGRVFHINANGDGTFNTVIQNMTIKNGKQAPSALSGLGGGIFMDGFDFNGGGTPIRDGTLIVSNCVVTDNYCSLDGGGIWSVDSTVTINSTSVISNNIVGDGDGAGVFHSGEHKVVISGSTISGNTANSAAANFGRGGGIRSGGTESTTISGSTIQNNQAEFDGGGVYMASFGGPPMQITGGTISGNTSGGNGGGVWSDQDPSGAAFGHNLLTSVTIKDNTATGNGGGIFHSRGTLDINGCTIGSTTAGENNAAVLGGGIFASPTTAGNVSPENGTVNFITASSSIIGNTAITSGGGIYISNFLNGAVTSTSTVTYSVSGAIGGTTTAHGNSAATGGGVFINSGSLTMPNSSSIQNNTATGNGGGINAVAGSITLNGLTLKGNKADSDANGSGNGGGIFNNGGSFTLGNTSAVTIGGAVAGEPNSAANGGGISNNGGTLSIVGSVVGNSATTNGGELLTSGGTVTLSGTTIDSNTAVSGDGLSITGGAINGSGSIAVNGGDSINLTGGTFTSTSGTFSLTGNFTNSGASFIHNGGTFTFNGSGTQTIGGTTASTFNNLTTNNGSGVTLGNSETVAGALTLTSGVLAIGSNTLTLNGTVSATGGSLTSNANGMVNYNQSSSGQNVLAANYGNLTFSNFAKTLPSGGVVQIRGTFTTGAGGGHTVTGSTVEYNGTSAQTMPSGFTTYNNLTLNNPAGVTGFPGLTVLGLLRIQAGTFTSSSTYKDVQIDNGATLAGVNATTINVSGNWTNNGTFTANGNTVDFNGSSAQTVGGSSNTDFSGLTINNSAGVGLSSNTVVNGALTLTNGTLGIGATTLTLNSAVSSTSGTINGGAGSTVNYNQGINGQGVASGIYDNLTFSNFNKILASTGTIAISGVFTAGSATGHTVTGSTINFNGSVAQTIPAFNYHNLTSSGSGARTLASSGIIRIAGTFSPGANAYTISGSTVEYNGTSAQTLPSPFTTYDNLTLNNAAGTTGFSGLTVTGLIEVKAGTFTSSSTYKDVQIDAGATLAASPGSTINVSGGWTNNGGTFTPNNGTVNFNGAAMQTIGGTSASTFNNLTNSNSAGVTFSQNQTVNGVLNLASSDIITSANILTMPAGGTSTGIFDVVGNVKRTGFVAGGASLSFGNQFNTIRINSGAVPTDITINLVKAAPVGFSSAVQRTYTITPNGAHGPITLRLHYLDAELNGNLPETSLNLRRFNGTGWSPVVATLADTTDNWLENNAVMTLSPWTFSTFTPTASDGTVTGRIVDNNGLVVEGAVIRLSGTQNRKVITDANGLYRFDNVETGGFYTVTPSRANYLFTPSQRSFSQLGSNTEATFNATFDGESANPLDTPDYFVRQHYVDFLGREPDEGGFNYWSDQILLCGADVQCVERRRINVSAAFFFSIEFQQTGGFVDRLYRLSFDRRPLYAEFMSDVRSMNGVVVLQGDWQNELQIRKVVFIDSWIQRPAFRNAYDTLSDGTFVDTLIGNTGVPYSTAERNALANGLIGGTLTRAQVVRQIVDDGRFNAAKFSEQFVLMEYFGYLRRNPDEAGYQFWLKKLNDFHGNFEQAEMVKAFLISIEYRQRFPR